MSKAAELANLIGNINVGGGGVNRNVIINGAMNVCQRSVSATGLGASSGYFVCDRWQVDFSNTAGRLTMTQDSSAPEGFANSIKLACTTADTSIASDEQLKLQQKIEGQNLQAFAKGTSSAKPFAVSFYVKGNASATYVCELFDEDNTRQCSKTFNVTTDWTRVELTFPADTTGALDDDNASSLTFRIYLHAGSNFTSGTLNSSGFASSTNANRAVGISSFFDSTDRTFFITGVQLEVGQNPTEFEHEPFETTLARCKRYFQKSYNYSDAVGTVTSDARVYWQTSQQWGVTSIPTGPIIQGYITLHPSLRATATVVPYSPVSGTANRIVLGSASSSDVTPNSWLQQAPSTVHIGYPQNAGGAGFANDDHVLFHWTADSEL